MYGSVRDAASGGCRTGRIAACAARYRRHPSAVMPFAMRPARLLLSALLLLSSSLQAADDAPLYLVDRGNLATHASLLTPGQQALIAALPDSFRMPVHAASGGPPASTGPHAGGTARLAEEGELLDYGGGLPFPNLDDRDPDGGLKAIWNHRLRWRGGGRRRATVQAVVSADGDLSLIYEHEYSRFPGRPSPLLAQQLFGIAEPARLAGAVKLLHERLSGPPLAWQRSPGAGLPSFRETTEAGGDTAVIGADDLCNEDQREGFSGSPERWRWKLVGRGVRLMPWAADRFHAHDRAPARLLGPRHPDLALLRYEPRRVIQLEATLKPGRSGPWPRRHYYLDEATWQVLLVELHGRDDRLQRVQEIHPRMLGDMLLAAVDVIHDLPGRRYRVGGLETRADATELVAPDAEDFAPGRGARWAKSVGAVPARK